MLLGGGGLLAYPPASAGPIITEFMASNLSGLLDEDQEASDWIEIYNPDLQPVSLAGWSLSDSARNLARWRFPEVTLPPLGFRVVFASGKNRAQADRELHTNFQLAQEGEFLALVEPDGQTVASLFAPGYPRQAPDIAYGLPMLRETRTLAPGSEGTRFLVPMDNVVGTIWTRADYDDSAWTPAVLPLGYARPAGEGPEPPEADPPSTDVILPGDFLVPTSPNSPGNEGVINAIDDDPRTKYLNFDKLNAGLTVTLSAGEATVDGLRLTTANDAAERDPTGFVLSGSNDGTTFTEIARGPLSPPTARFTSWSIAFPASPPYRHFRLLFPTVRNAGAAVAVQIAEVELLGRSGPPPAPLEDLIRTSVEGALRGKGHGLYVRLPFVLESPAEPARLQLSLRYEDGYIAYLNGTEVARANAPLNATALSSSLTNRLRRAAGSEVTVDLSAKAGLLIQGRNVLAVHGLNSRPDSGDFLLEARLQQTRILLGAPGHLPAPSPGEPNPESAGGLIEALQVSAPRGWQEGLMTVTLACSTPEALVRYTLDGSRPTSSHGEIYTAPLQVARTTVLRAAAFREGWHPSPVITRTYLFPSDIRQQDAAGARAAGFPANWGSTPADYGLDRRVVGTGGTDAFGGRYVEAFLSELKALPTISLVLPMDDLFGPQGIYANPEGRGAAWERAASFEWIPGGSGTPSLEAFQQDAGLRIQGGAFRSFGLSRKKSFRLVFRGEYGARRLEQPLFGPGAAPWFNTLILRANSNDAWPYGDSRAVYIRDRFAMDTARELGIPASHSGFAHLFLNGQYWGLYNPVERPDAAFAEAYVGGDKDTWDSINQDSAPDGNYDAWNRLLAASGQDLSRTDNYQRIQGNNPDGTRNPSFEALIDVDNYIDYLLLNFYVGNTDWPHRNWWAGRRRDGNDGVGFQFRPWDTETALDFSGLDADVTGASVAVARPYASLQRNADFRARFADHVHRHFSPGGALYVNPASPAWDPAHPENNRPAARFAAAAAEARAGIVGESARWGDQMGTPLRTRDAQWQPEVDSLLRNYFPQRSARVLAQLQRARLYPRTPAPTFNVPGGPVPRGFALVLTAPAGVLYYTVDGTDPRGPGGAARGLPYSTPMVLGSETRILARTLNNGEWSPLAEASFTLTTPELTALDFTAAWEEPGRVRLRFMARAGLGYTVYQTRSLAEDRWTVLHAGAPRGVAGPVEMVLDPGETGGEPRFFRVSIP